MAVIKRLLLVILLFKLCFCFVLSVKGESETLREKRHHPDKHVSFHHVYDFGHKVVHKTSDFKVGPDGISHSKHFFVKKHDPHHLKGHGGLSHYEENNYGHQKPNPFIDITHDKKHFDNHYPSDVIYLKENKKSKAVTLDEYMKTKKSSNVPGHQVRESDEPNDYVDDRNNFDHLDYQGNFGMNPRKIPEDFDDF